MPKTAVAVLTYRRNQALQTFLESVHKHCPSAPVAVFEDCANFDDTRATLTSGATPAGVDREMDAEVWIRPEFTSYLGRRNVGVAAQSNKALKWFAELGDDYTHLMLCNDDVEFLGDAAAAYAKAHADLKVGLFCYCDPALGEEYVGPVIPVLGHKVHVLPQGRATGLVMSLTRAVLQRIGYYDVVFGRMGQEHVDYVNRARMAGHVNLRGKPQYCLDVQTGTLRMQITRSSVSGSERAALDAYANQVIQRSAARYQTETWHRPYRLLHPPRAGAYGGAGIPVALLEAVGYRLLIDYEYHDARSTH